MLVKVWRQGLPLTLEERELNEIMEFDRVIVVSADGTVSYASDGIYAPELHDGELDPGSDGWQLMTGYTGQYSYHGPIMHASEFIGGRMAEDIIANPGMYVALVDYPWDGQSEPDGWAVAYIHA